MKHRRKGYLLGEVLITIALCGGVVSMATVALHSVYRMHRHTTARQEHRREVRRFAFRFREDAHAALTAAPGEPVKEGVTLELPDAGTVAYQTTDEGIARVLRREGKLIHRDRFSFLPRTRVAWRVARSEGRDRVAIRLEPAAGHPRNRTVEVTIEAGIGIRWGGRIGEDADGTQP